MTEQHNKNYRVSDIFNCTRCGYCCQGETTVSLDREDRRRMVAALGMPMEKVRATYWRVTGDVVQMKTVDGHCIFYDADQGCTVHGGRPWRCGQWPLHPSILSDRNNLTAIRESCPGLNRSLSYDEFCQILRHLLQEQEKMLF